MQGGVVKACHVSRQCQPTRASEQFDRGQWVGRHARDCNRPLDTVQEYDRGCFLPESTFRDLLALFAKTQEIAQVIEKQGFLT